MNKKSSVYKFFFCYPWTLFGYVMREFLIPFFYCLVGLCLLFLLFSSFDIIGVCFENKPSLLLVLSFLSGTISMYLEWLLPASFLLATLYTMWQFCRHSELIAMRANGISFLTITQPILTIAIVFAALSYLNSEYYAPEASNRARAIKNADFKNDGNEIKKGVGFVFANRSWIIGEINLQKPNHLQDVSLTFSRPDGSKEYTVTATAADYFDDENLWYLTNPKYTYFDELNNQIPTPATVNVNSSLLPLFGVTEKPEYIVLQNKNSEFFSVNDHKDYLKMLKDPKKKEKVPIKYQIYNSYAAPFSIIIITLFAIPAGIASGRQSVFKGILIAIGLFLGFYLLTSLGMVFAIRGFFTPAFCAFFPSLVFFVAGAILFRKQR